MPTWDVSQLAPKTDSVVCRPHTWYRAIPLTVGSDAVLGHDRAARRVRACPVAYRGRRIPVPDNVSRGADRPLRLLVRVARVGSRVERRPPSPLVVLKVIFNITCLVMSWLQRAVWGCPAGPGPARSRVRGPRACRADDAQACGGCCESRRVADATCIGGQCIRRCPTVIETHGGAGERAALRAGLRPHHRYGSRPAAAAFTPAARPAHAVDRSR